MGAYLQLDSFPMSEEIIFQGYPQCLLHSSVLLHLLAFLLKATYSFYL